MAAGWTELTMGEFAAVARFEGDEDLVFADSFESGNTAWWGDWGP